MIQEPSIESSLAGASVSVVVPVYNSESTIEELCTRLIATFEGCGLGFEIIRLQDGGS